MKLLEIAFWVAGSTQVAFYAASEAWDVFEQHRNQVTAVVVTLEVEREVAFEVEADSSVGTETQPDGTAMPVTWQAQACVREGTDNCALEWDADFSEMLSRWNAYEQIATSETR